MNIVTVQDKDYPTLLRQTGRNAPKQLYYKGSWNPEIFENCLAVVGSRRMTSYGRQVTDRLVTEAAAAGITIVSGFMYGGDAAAHKAALRAGGRTIAVMPCGIERIHPEYQEALYNEILENKGLIISEYEGDMMPVNWTYPRRNRIVAGLSKAVLVVEAGLRSGTLITANFAKKFGRKVFAVPGPITSEVSKGSLRLLKEGAEMVTGAEEILGYYELRKQNFEKSFGGHPLSSPSSPGAVRHLASRGPRPNPDFRNLFSEPLEKQILEELRLEPMGTDDLARTIGLPVSELGVTLSLMQLKGLIREGGGKYHIP